MPTTFIRMKNNGINASVISRILRSLQSKFRISKEIYTDTFYFIYFKIMYEKQPLKQILFDLRSSKQRVVVNVEIFLKYIL